MNCFTNLALVAGLCGGCASGPTVQRLLSESGKRFEDAYPISPTRANIFICRNPQLFTMTVNVDGLPTQVPLAGGTFLPLQIAPGAHQITLKNDVGHNEEKTVNISVAAGRNYYFRTGIGFISPKDLKALSEDEGQKAILGGRPPGVSGFIIPEAETGGGSISQPKQPIIPESKPK